MLPYIILALVSLVLGSLTGIYQFYHLTYLSLGIPLAILYIHKQGMKNLVINRRLTQERIFSGESSQVRLTVTNGGRWPIFWLSYDEVIPHRLHIPPSKQGVSFLWPGEKITVDYCLDGNRRGFYTLGPLKIEAGDGLGFLEEKMIYETGQRLIIYPRLYPLEQLGLPSRIIYGDLVWPQKIYHDPGRVRAIREYQPGDSFRDIYWPGTASLGELLVKEYESTITIENLLYINLNQQEYQLKGLEPKVELAIEVAASIAHYLITHNQTVGLVTNGIDPLQGNQSIAPGQGLDHLMEIMELLARLELAEDAPFMPLLEEYRQYYSPGSTVLMITEIDSAELMEKSLDLCRRGLNLLIIVLGDQILHTEYLNRPYTENLVILSVEHKSLGREEDIYGRGA